MGTNRYLPQMLTYIARAARDREAVTDALATIEQFNTRLAAEKSAWFWPTIGAALVTKHHWLVIACDSCGTVIEMDLTVKRRDPEGRTIAASRRASQIEASFDPTPHVGQGGPLRAKQGWA